MGCASSGFLHNDDDFTHVGHHIVSLTSTTYGLLTLDPTDTARTQMATAAPPTAPSRFTLGSFFLSPLSESKSARSEPEVINSWELMAGLDTDSFRFSPLPPTEARFPKYVSPLRENLNPNDKLLRERRSNLELDRFESICPPRGENRVVVYTTTLRGVRKTYEACNAVRSAVLGLGAKICERDISMDCGFKEELRELMKGKGRDSVVPPRAFVKGRYVGGAEEVLRLHEEGLLGELLKGLPRDNGGKVCEGCGGVRFLPCFLCSGSCKVVMVVKEVKGRRQGRDVVVRCPDCNENGLVLCPICS